MKPVYLTLFFSLLLLFKVQAQVGINNTAPKATLDIEASNVAAPNNDDGILIPRIDDFPSTNPTTNQEGMMVFVTGNGAPTKGFYYWDNGTTSWVAINGVKNTLDGAYDEGGAGMGRIITTDNGAVDVQGTGGIRVEGDIAAAANIIHDGDNNTFITFTPDRVRIDAGGRNYMDIQHTDTEVTFNEDSTQSDFRVESGNEEYMLFVDGSKDAVGIGQNNPKSPLHVGISTTFDLSYANTGQDGLYLKGSNNNGGINTVGSSIGFGPNHTARSNQRKAAIASIQTTSDEDQVGLAFYTHSSPINLSDMRESMRLTHQGFLGINNTNPDATLDVVGTMQFVDGNQTNGYVLTSDANGNARWSNPSSLVSKSVVQAALSTNQSIAASTLTKIAFDQTVTDRNTEFDTVNNRFVATNQGFYNITANIWVSGSGSYTLYITKNGSTAADIIAQINSNLSESPTISIATVEELAAGDYLEAYINGSAIGTINQTNDFTQFNVFQID